MERQKLHKVQIQHLHFPCVVHVHVLAMMLLTSELLATAASVVDIQYHQRQGIMQTHLSLEINALVSGDECVCNWRKTRLPPVTNALKWDVNAFALACKRLCFMVKIHFDHTHAWFATHV